MPDRFDVYYTRDERDNLAAQSVTLDGHRARVGRTRDPRFGLVTPVGPGHGGPVEYAWSTIARVINVRGGAFHS